MPTLYALKIASILWSPEELEQHSIVDRVCRRVTERSPFSIQEDLDKIAILKRM